MVTYRYFFCVLLVVFGGCGTGANDNRPARVPVSGVITMAGKPVGQADIIFSADSGGSAAFAMTDAEGLFRLSTFGDKDGAIPGAYSVVVRKQEEKGALSTAEAEAYVRRYNRPPPSPKYIDLIPKKYGEAATSDLRVEVKKGEENNFTFELQL